MKKGNFIISLDFELHWGAAEKWDLTDKEVKKYFENTRVSIPLVLDLFKKYQIHATWATVGFLFAKNKEQLLKYIPENKPSYYNSSLSYYRLLDNNEIGNNEDDDPYHFAPSIISQIIKTQNQEMSSHTFAHYYCNEKGQNVEQFEADLIAAQKISKDNFNIELKSLVFPRNQFNSDYLYIAKKNGIKVVRSNPDVWFWKKKFKLLSLARAFDTLFPISKSLTFSQELKIQEGILLLPASRFLRSYSNKEKLIHKIKLNRIKSEMSLAAKEGKGYHLWWHPHNFGYSMKENLSFLEDILKHYKILNDKYGFISVNMIEMNK